MEQTFMREKKILPLVLSMSLPMVISMAVNSLYNIVDSYFVAKLSDNAMTALALVYPIQNLIISIAVGFGVGINAAVAYFLGAGEQRRADQAVSQGILFSVIHGLILTVVCILVMPLFLGMFTQDAEVVGMALTYSMRAFLFSVMVTVGVTFEKIFQSIGQMKVSMFSMICGCVTNIILDPLMIFGAGPIPAMGIAGAAYATGIGQIVSLGIYLFTYFLHSVPFKVRISCLKPDRQVLSRLYSVGVPATLNMALPSFLISALNGILAGFSSQYVLVLGVYYKLQTFIYLTASGIVQGIRPLIGYNYGAGERERVEEIYHTALKLAVLVMIMGTVLSWAVPEQLIGLFTSSKEVVRIGVTALHIISVGFAVSAVSVTVSGALEGLGLGIPSMYISLSRYIVLMIPTAVLFSRFLGANGVWHAFWFTEFVTAAFAWLLYRRIFGRVMPKGKNDTL